MVVNAGSQLTLMNTIFFNNSAPLGGAILFSLSSSSSIQASIVGSIFEKNSANTDGGAVQQGYKLLMGAQFTFQEGLSIITRHWNMVVL